MQNLKPDRDGKVLVALHEVRGALITATASLTTGTAGSLIVGDADKMLDIIEISFANNSTVGAHVALVNDGTTVRDIDIPATSTIQLFFDAPLEQITKATPWNVDMTDVTGTTVVVNASLIKREK